MQCKGISKQKHTLKMLLASNFAYSCCFRYGQHLKLNSSRKHTVLLNPDGIDIECIIIFSQQKFR